MDNYIFKLKSRQLKSIASKQIALFLTDKKAIDSNLLYSLARAVSHILSYNT